MRCSLLGCFAVITLAFASAGVDADTSSLSFPPADSAATFLIRVSWVDKPDGKPQQSTGTGVSIDANGTIMTVKHLFPDAAGADGVEILAQSAPSDTKGFHLECKPVPQVDVAFCTPKDEPRPYPFPAQVALLPVHESQSVWIRGYPEGGPLEGAPGQIQIVESPLAKTSALLVAGYSGGPVYLDGKLVGLVHDGEPVAQVSDPNVMGLGRFTLLRDAAQYIPPEQLDAMINSEQEAMGQLNVFFARVQGIIYSEEIGRAETAGIFGGPNSVLHNPGAILGFSGAVTGNGAYQAVGPSGSSSLSNRTSILRQQLLSLQPIAGGNARPDFLSISYSINETNDKNLFLTSNKMHYTTGVINSENGYSISGYRLDKLSAAGVSDERVVISNGGHAIEYSCELESGSLFNKHQGWLKARLIVNQKKIE